jgi:Lipocalin-like domain
MKKTVLALTLLFTSLFTTAQSPVGKWKVTSHISSFGGETFDSQKALLKQRPCAAKVFYEINADATYRLNAASSGCDERYIKIQEKLWSKTNWQLKGNVLTLSTQKDFLVGQSYKITISGNKMTWIGTEGQGTIVYQKL